MSNIINKIRISGTTYELPVGISSGEVQTMISTATSGITERLSEDEEVTAAALNDLEDSKQDKLSAGTGISISGNVISATGGGGGNPTVELTQAQYDALVESGTVQPDTYYIITDAQAGDLTQYWTSAQTNSAITAAVSGKQDTLVSGSNIKTINNESILGSGNIDIQGGGGKAVSGGTNISITTGETADTINCTLPIYSNINDRNGDIAIGTNLTGASSDYKNLLIGRRIEIGAESTSNCNLGIGFNTSNNTTSKNTIYGSGNVAIGANFEIGTSSNNRNNNCVVIGYGTKSNINNGVAIGYNAVASGTTKTNLNNQITVDTSNQVYIYNKDNTEMICLQDNLGGTASSAITSGDTNAVQGGAVYDKFDEVEQVTAAGLNALNDKFGGLKLMKLTQNEYNALSPNYDSNTLYIIVN